MREPVMEIQGMNRESDELVIDHQACEFEALKPYLLAAGGTTPPRNCE
jgi:hypothetical protein